MGNTPRFFHSKYRRRDPRYCGFSKLLQELPLYLIRDYLQNRIPSKELVQKLQIYANDISLLSNQSSAYVKGIIITSAHMAKGLEFDEVIIPQTDDKNYHSNIDKSMLYVATTRAMHKLTLTYSVSSPSCRFL